VKNRMQEICTSGSVRGGDGNIPTYSAIRLAERRQVPLEGAIFLQLGQGGEKLQLPGGIGLLQSLDE